MFWLSGEITYQIPWAFLISNILISILLTWLYNNTGGSVMVTLINHTMFNLSVPMLPALQTTMGSMFFMFALIASIIIIVRIWGPGQLVRVKEK
jgi:membrane protease YdiL (CAAX protease family)